MNNALPLKTLLTYFDLSINSIETEKGWRELTQDGTPLIKKQQDGRCMILFLWRDPEGDKKTSTTCSVILHVNAITNHNSWQPTCFSRHNDSDLWFAYLNVEADWRSSYSFIPIKAKQLARLNTQQQDRSREAQRRWWLDVVKQQQPDPLNKYPDIASGWGLCSPLHLPDAAQELGWQVWDQGRLDKKDSMQCQSLPWHSLTLDNSRDCTIFSTSTGKAPLVILLDGQKWGENTGTLAVLKHLTSIGKLAPAHYLLIPSLDNQTRWQELSCYQPFWQAIIDQLLPDVQQHLLTRNMNITEYLVAGQSLGGLSALYAGAYFPTYFNKVITLSGSFWWPEIERMQDPDAFKLHDQQWDKVVPNNSLADRVLKQQISVSGLHIYQTVGNAEKDLRTYNDMHNQVLQQHGALVTYHKLQGGHDWLSWRSGLINGLVTLLPGALLSS